MKNNWWMEAVVYQIYPMSFYDSDGSGIGDLRGIIQKLDYLKDLGVTVLWLCPIYQSPMADNGYDVSDYYQIAQQFGTIEDMDELIAQANHKGMKIILDLITNYCSDEHEWFQRALKEPESKEASYFYFAKSTNGAPNNWRSIFGGSVWEAVGDDRYYYHTFGKKQPDLNWENKELRSEIYKMTNWWLNKGIAGFRVDAITFIKKDTTFQNHYPTLDHGLYPIEKLENYPGIDAFLTELKNETFKRSNCMTVAEAPGVPNEQIADYCGKNGYFSMIFEFSYADMNQYNPEWSVGEFKRRIFESQIESQKGGWLGVFLENHDQPRSPSKYIKPEDLDAFHDYPKTMLATLYFLLRGTPFIYQGQEIGMENYPFNGLDDFRDIMAIQCYQESIDIGGSKTSVLEGLKHTTRDNGRTPMQWNDSVNAGFSAVTPWIAVNPNYTCLNAEAQEAKDDSLLNFYKRLISLRKDRKIKDLFVYGDFQPIESNDDMFVYLRTYGEKRALVVCNFSNQEQTIELPFSPEKILLCNYTQLRLDGTKLHCLPYQAIVLAE
ncbi:MAG: alpha-glucosidase [Eubacteriales bacterium]|jgi:glycosidase|nr:alpha-glucosidase [Eubacteriales bacterium]